MGTQSAIDIQKRGMLMRKLFYLVFFFQKVTLELESWGEESDGMGIILGLAFLCAGLDLVFDYYNYFKNIKVLRGLRYVQCVVVMFMFYYSPLSVDSLLIIIMIFTMYLSDFFLSMEITGRERAIYCLFSVGLPFSAFALCRRIVYSDGMETLLFSDVLLLMMVLLMEFLSAADYVETFSYKILDQHHELSKIAEKNKNILNMQEKIHYTNMLLNTQKAELQQAYKQIKEANEEMAAQTEILHYIAMSVDIPDISDRITDAIMRVKKLGFCAVYIKENVYFNKYANHVIKTNIDGLQSEIEENIENIYGEMTSCYKREEMDYESLKRRFPFLETADMNSLYIKVLEQDDKICGMFMIGDKRHNRFGDNMSFYDAIIVQYGIAINNVKNYNEMRHMARKDGLTGINNRVYFTQLFKKSIEKTIRSDGHISVALFDIDKFKSVNDTYGHLAGDEVIKRIATVTEQCIDKYNGFICRYGGEEFVVVLPERTLEAAQLIIQELFEEICSQVVHYGEWDIHMSVSIGLTAYPEVCINPDDLLKRADWCTYYAKEHGRHQICLDDGNIQKD